MREIEKLIGEDLIGTSEAYRESVRTNYEKYFEYSQLPIRCKRDYLNTEKIRSNARIMLNNINLIIDNKCNILMTVAEYYNVPFLIASFLERYYCTAIKDDTYVSKILYINTPNFLQSIKNSYDKDDMSIMFYDKSILMKEIYCADYVFWDEFIHIKTDWEVEKIYDILSIRYKNCLGNSFIYDDIRYIFNPVGTKLHDGDMEAIMDLTYDRKKTDMSGTKLEIIKE